MSDFALREIAPERAEAALTRLCRDYWLPLYRFIRRRGYSKADAEDLTQGFFAYLFEKRAYTAPDRNKGQFRTFLILLLKRYLRAIHRQESTQKRGGGQALVSLDGEISARESELLSAAAGDEERAFERYWAATLVTRSIDALAAEYSSGTKARVYAELRPFLTGGIGLPSLDQAAKRLGVPIETVRSHLFRLRGRYRALLRAEVARTVPSEADINEELRYLCQILIASG